MNENNNRKSFRSAVNRVVKMKRRGSRYIGRPINNVWELFSDYSKESTIHGIRYLGEKKRHWIERIWWTLTIIIAVIASTWFISQTWWRWQSTPVIISFADEATPISNIPFPAITICPDITFRRNSFNYTNIWNLLSTPNFTDINLSDETIRKVNALASANFCFPPHYLDHYIKYKNITIDRNILSYLKEVLPPLFQLKNNACSFAESLDKFKCEKIFSKILTDGGLCYTFNQMSSMDIYRSNVLADDFPMLKNFETDYTHITGFEMMLQVPKNVDFDIQCSRSLEGLKMQIHSADEVPRFRKHHYHIPFDHDVQISVRPNIMSTTQGVIENYTKKQRKCIADNEHELIFFKKYTQRNCHLDVLAVQASKICGCVPFWMPRQNHTKVCSIWKEFKAITYIERSMHSSNLTTKCLPACNSTSYETDISISKVDRNSLDRELPNVSGGFKLVQISVTFKDQQYYSTLRSEMYDKLSFIAACGGILSLFMGVSILSVIEIFYYATLRLSCNFRKQNVQKLQTKCSEEANVSNARNRKVAKRQCAVNFIDCNQL